MDMVDARLKDGLGALVSGQITQFYQERHGLLVRVRLVGQD